MTSDESIAELISNLCVSWKEAATVDGGITIGSATEQHRLLNNGIEFHTLTYLEIRAALVGLTDVLLLPGLNTVIDRDHEFLWSWLTEVLAGGEGPLSSRTNHSLFSATEVTARAALANARPGTEAAFSRRAQVRTLLEHNATQYLNCAHTTLAYLAFPFLEAIARNACKNYVDQTGKVLRPFPRKAGKDYTVNSRCSNLGDLLRLLSSGEVSTTLGHDLEGLLAHIHAFDLAASDGATVVFEWRNSSLHGEASLPTIGGTMLSLALMIALDGIRDEYEEHRVAALNRASREVPNEQTIGAPYRSPLSFYPPYF